MPFGTNGFQGTQFKSLPSTTERQVGTPATSMTSSAFCMRLTTK
jgi:hypothetical protein